MDAADGGSGWTAARRRQLGLLGAAIAGALALGCAMLTLVYWAFASVGETGDSADGENGAALAPLVLSPVVVLLLVSRDIRYYPSDTSILRTLETKPHDTPDQRPLGVGQ